MNNASRKSEVANKLAAEPELSERMNAAPSQEAQGGVVYPRRRRLLTGSAAGAGVFLAMQAKTALGGTCQSPSAMLSGNLSNHPHDNTTCSGGRSPGFWKQPQHFVYWVGLTPPTFKSTANITNDCKSGLNKVSPCDLATRGTLLGNVFTGAPAVGVWEVLVWPTSYPNVTTNSPAPCTVGTGSSDIFGGKGHLLRTLVAAYLNRGAQPTQYPISTDQIVAMWNAVKNGGIYYPNGGTSGAGLDADGVRTYIDGMYHIGALNDVQGCDKN